MGDLCDADWIATLTITIGYERPGVAVTTGAAELFTQRALEPVRATVH